MPSQIMFVATGDAVALLESPDGDQWAVTTSLDGLGVQCLAVDPSNRDRIYAGTFDNGLWRSRDGGHQWDRVGEDSLSDRILSVAFAPARQANGQAAVYVGGEPSALYRSEDDGQSWESFPALTELPSAPEWSFPPRPWTSHVRWITSHPLDAETIYVGIELGGVMTSRDGGTSWEDRKPGSYHDCHCLATHPAAPDRVYEAAGGGVALSTDRGMTWTPVDEGMDRHYVWSVVTDTRDPDLWFVSAAQGARFAHRNDGTADARLYRRRGDQPWEALGGDGHGLPRSLPYMPYALIAPRDKEKTILAGFQHGEIWRSEDHGDSWRKLSISLPGIAGHERMSHVRRPKRS
jgi:photosystem II stability/assembly factor-like uncharacterized protein